MIVFFFFLVLVVLLLVLLGARVDSVSIWMRADLTRSRRGWGIAVVGMGVDVVFGFGFGFGVVSEMVVVFCFFSSVEMR